MYLIPEDVYRQTLQQQQQPDGGTPIGHVRARMRQIQQQQNGDVDAQAAKFHQEFKRMNKLARDDEERPLNVRLRNFQEIADVLPPSSAPVEASSRKKIKLATRRRRNVPPKKAKVVKGNNEQEEEKEEEEEEWADASNEDPSTPPKLRQRLQHMPSSSSAKEGQNNERAELREHIRQHAKELGITADGHVLKADGATVWKTSNVDEIIAHMLSKRQQFRQAPTGYREFVGRARGDPFLQIYLLQQQQGKGYQKTHKKLPPTMIKFKPSLW